MVRGLEHFKKHFEDFKDQYVLIGGTACTVVMEDAGIDFRATKDLDIVLCVETLSNDFVFRLWDYIKEGGYKNRQKSTGKKLFYRFYDPKDMAFPMMLELFSRKPDALDIGEDSLLTPIPVEEETCSLSAILLDDEYYNLVKQGKIEISGLPVIPAQYLVPLKAKAWLNFMSQRDSGEQVDERDIRKHRNDVFRLFQMLSPDDSVFLPVSIQKDLEFFLDAMVNERSLKLKDLGFRERTLEMIIASLRKIYQISP